MSSHLPEEAEGWFPAVVLARTALGALCIDPGWNYLIEIGLSLDELRPYSGLDRLRRQLTKSPGTQHHLCLAADLHRRGYLSELEPSTGSGRATNDMRSRIDGREYDIEVKEFTSDEPGSRLKKEILRKAQNLPSCLSRPVVFHAVLAERRTFEKPKEDRFFADVLNLGDDLPEAISAVVAGRRFVDSAGGRVKRDVEHIVINPVAKVPSLFSDLEVLFAKNYASVKYPMFGPRNAIFGTRPD